MLAGRYLMQLVDQGTLSLERLATYWSMVLCSSASSVPSWGLCWSTARLIWWPSVRARARDTRAARTHTTAHTRQHGMVAMVTRLVLVAAPVLLSFGPTMCCCEWCVRAALQWGVLYTRWVAAALAPPSQGGRLLLHSSGVCLLHSMGVLYVTSTS